jgi:hypothetical protein
VEHHVARDLLGAYVDDELEQPTRAALEAHLSTCDDCRRLLGDGEPPVAMPAASMTPTWDERGLRKAVRRTLTRVTLTATAIALMVVLVAWLLPRLPIGQPGYVARGDWLEPTAEATYDLPLLFNPGAFVSDWSMNADGLVGKTFEVGIGRHVGSAVEPLGTTHLDVGPRLRGPGAGLIALKPSPWPEFSFSDATLTSPWQPERLPEGTVVTVLLDWEEPITVADADALVGAADASLIWAAFHLDWVRVFGGVPDEHDEQEPRGWDPTGDIGYSTCQSPEQLLASLHDSVQRGAVGLGGGGWDARGHGVAGALEQVRRATANLAAVDVLEPLLDAGAYHPLTYRTEVAAWLAENEPGVNAVVVTGPTDQVTDVIERADPSRAQILDIDFYNWTESIC